MNVNPYEPPQPPRAFPYPQVPSPTVNRTPFVLAAVGAWCASAYWALMTLLIGAGVMTGASSGVALFFPVILIGLYAVRGAQIFKGDPAAVRRILWLHGIGALAALSQAARSHGIVAALQGLKVVINLCGLAAAFWAYRAIQRAFASPVGITR
ncbi:MAG TPA: hypothetical protein VGI39_31255 [Polyangiaceae bacterium]|jgi:hypothetical protein